MADCTDPTMRDLLPLLLHAGGDGPGRRRVEDHLRDCGACRDELQLLRRVRGATATPALNLARIVGAVPPYRRTWLRGHGRAVLASAAVAASVLIAVSVLSDGNPSAGHEPAPGAASGTPLTASPRELAIGDNLSGLSDADLRALVEEIEALEAVPELEPDVVALPAVHGEGF